MLDQEAMQIARKRLSAEQPRRRHFFLADIERVQSDFAARGLERSGTRIQAIADVCAKEIEGAADRLWEIVRDLIRQEGDPSPEELRTLYGQIDELWIPYCSAGPLRQFEAICSGDNISQSIKKATHLYDRNDGAHMRLQSQVEEFLRSERNRRAGENVSRRHGSGIFLSHAASDEHIALLLKQEIERRLPGIKVFCSSDPTDLPPGTKWSPKIQEALQGSNVLIFVATERGLQRPWVWFECGTFWFTKKQIVPLCLGEVRKNTLRPPLSELQAINGDDSGDLKTAFEVVATATGSSFSDRSDLKTLSEKLKQLDREAASALSTLSGWVGIDWKGRFLAYDGPYEDLREIEDRNFETSMQQALEAAGYSVSLYEKNNFPAMGDAVHFVRLTDRKSWRCRIVRGSAYLVAKPS
jgi:hypothetical protein